MCRLNLAPPALLEPAGGVLRVVAPFESGSNDAIRLPEATLLPLDATIAVGVLKPKRRPEEALAAIPGVDRR